MNAAEKSPSFESAPKAPAVPSRQLRTRNRFVALVAGAIAGGIAWVIFLQFLSVMPFRDDEEWTGGPEVSQVQDLLVFSTGLILFAVVGGLAVRALCAPLRLPKSPRALKPT